jgi:hypothetical protein
MTTKKDLLKLVRKCCLECVGDNSQEVESCTSLGCVWYPYRFGKDPKPSKKRQILAPSKKRP